MAVKISWLGHASFKIEGSKEFKIYIDPWKIRERDEADLVLVTHSHYDHFSSKDIKKIQSEKTYILIPADVAGKIKGRVKEVKPGDEISFEGVNVKVVPAYNIGKPYHPKGNEWVGYVVDIEGVSIYHAGDTDFIPEMKEINPYVALLPIGGTYTMGVEDAVRAVESLNPRIVIPMHYGDIVGSAEDARKFAEKCEGKTTVKVINVGESLKIEAGG